MINISIVGSTGSIGTQALDVIRCFPDKFSVVALSANSNWELLLKQIIEFKPLKAVLIDNIAFSKLKENVPNYLNTELICGEFGIEEISSMDETELVLISTVGMSGLKPVLSALNAGKQLALATKEALVSGGDLVIPLAKSKNITIRPVDSEHSAIFQCIGDNREFLKKVILTCSGGALRNFTVEQLKYATVDDVLAHPNWSMGKKITVDCATLMNKGFEMIEACHLFNLLPNQVEIVIHPQSIIHSAVEFFDGSIIAQMSKPDMKLAIQYAFSYPERFEKNWTNTDFFSLPALTFEKPDFDKFPCLKIAFDSFAKGGTMPASLNAVNEEAVFAFLKKEIKFNDIFKIIEMTLSKVECLPSSIENIFYADSEARRISGVFIERMKNNNVN